MATNAPAFLEAMSPNVTPKKRIGTLRTGSPSFDYELLGTGGLVPGVLYELFGTEHSGKTTLAIIYAALFQKQHPNKWIIWLDVERTFDRDYAETLGLKIDPPNKIYFSNKTTVEAVLRDAAVAMGSGGEGEVGLLIVDSIGAMLPSKNFAKMFEGKNQAQWSTPQVGSFATPVQTGVKAVRSASSIKGMEYEPICIFINQVRPKIGLNPNLHYQEHDKYDTPGGQYLKHACEVKQWVSKKAIRLEKGGKVKKLKDQFGLKITLTKNKHGFEGETGAKDADMQIPNFVVHLKPGNHPSCLHRMVNERLFQDLILGYGDCDVSLRAGNVTVKERTDEEKKKVLFKGTEKEFWSAIYEDPTEIEQQCSSKGKIKFMRGPNVSKRR